MNLFNLFRSARRSHGATSAPRRLLGVEHLEHRWVLNAAWGFPSRCESSPEPEPETAQPAAFAIPPTATNADTATDSLENSCRFVREAFANGFTERNGWNQSPDEDTAALAEGVSCRKNGEENGTEDVSAPAALTTPQTEAPAVAASVAEAPTAEDLTTQDLTTQDLTTQDLVDEELREEALANEMAAAAARSMDVAPSALTTEANALAAPNGPALRPETLDPFYAQLGGDSVAIETLEPLGAVPPLEPLSPIGGTSPLGPP